MPDQNRSYPEKLEIFGEGVMCAQRAHSLKTKYEIRKSRFLLWKERASLKLKLLIIAGAVLAFICFLAFLLM